jgi:hypothetical protein
MPDYIETLQAKRAINTDDQHRLALLQAVTDVKKAVEAGPRDITVKTDDTAVITALGKLETAVKALDKPEQDYSEVLTDIKQAVEAVKLEPTDLSELLAAISKLELSPAITVQAPEVDLVPLQDTIKEYFKPPETEQKLDLACYRAQDIKEDGDIQYVGFLNPDGNWYIIENDIKGNKMRYVFGSKGYAKAFSKAASYKYELLDKAIHATA